MPILDFDEAIKSSINKVEGNSTDDSSSKSSINIDNLIKSSINKIEKTNKTINKEIDKDTKESENEKEKKLKNDEDPDDDLEDNEDSIEELDSEEIEDNLEHPDEDSHEISDDMDDPQDNSNDKEIESVNDIDMPSTGDVEDISLYQQPKNDDYDKGKDNSKKFILFNYYKELYSILTSLEKTISINTAEAVDNKYYQYFKYCGVKILEMKEQIKDVMHNKFTLFSYVKLLKFYYLFKYNIFNVSKILENIFNNTSDNGDKKKDKKRKQSSKKDNTEIDTKRYFL